MGQSNDVGGRIHSFIKDKFPQARKRLLATTDNLLESGIVDSLGVLDMVAFLEREFSLAISDDELTPENFSSIAQIVAFVQRKSYPQVRAK